MDGWMDGWMDGFKSDDKLPIHGLLAFDDLSKMSR